VKNYTKKELQALKERADAGESLTDSQNEALKKFMGEENEPDSLAGTGTSSAGSVAGSEAGKENGDAGAEDVRRVGVQPDALPTGSAEGNSESVISDPAALAAELIEAKPQSDPSIVGVMKKRFQDEKKAKGAKRGPKPKGAVSSNGTVSTTDKGEEFKNQCRRAGEMCWDSLVLAGFTFMGPEWNHLPPQYAEDKKTLLYDERTVGRQAYADMFEAYGWNYLPPWLGAVTVTGTYVAYRIRMPETQKKVTSLKARLFLWWDTRQKKKKAEKEIKAAEKLKGELKDVKE
jgi:hypothetical protein